MNVSMPIAACLLDLDFPAAMVKAIPLLARTAGLLAHLAEEQSGRSASSWPRTARKPSPTTAARTAASAVMFEPAIETLPWAAAGRSSTIALYREQIARLFASSRFYRGKLAAAGFADRRRRRRPRRHRRAALHREGRAARHAAARTIRSAPISPSPMDDVARIYSTSGTTGTPSYVPLTRRRPRRLGAHLGALLCRLRASRRGDRLISTYNAGPFVAGATLDAFTQPRPLHHPGRQRQHRSPDGRRAAAQGRRHRADPVLCAASRRMGAPSAASTRRRPASRACWSPASRAAASRRMRARLEARLGRRGHRGDGHRRYRRLAVGRVPRAARACISAAAASSISS